MVFNHNGTAAGIDATYVAGDQKTICRVFVMPGVPKEMKAMFTRDVLPHVKQMSGVPSSSPARSTPSALAKAPSRKNSAT